MVVTSSDFDKFKVRRASDAVYGVNILIYGPAGIGKSTVAAGAADSEMGAPLLFMDAEGGSKAISDRDDITVMDVDNWQTLEDFTKVAKKVVGPLPWKTIVFDNCSEIINLVTKSVVGSDETAPSQPQWGRVAMEFLSWVRDWRTIGRDSGTNIVFIAWDSEEKDEIGRVKYHLQATPKIQKELPGMVDIIGMLSANEKNGKRIIDFTVNPKKSISKFRRSKADTALKIPNTIEFGLDVSPLADMIAVLRGGAEWPAASYDKKPTPS